MSTLRERLEDSGCSSEFITEALVFERLFTGDIDAFIEIVEDILISGEEYEPEEVEDDDTEEDDPIYRSDYNYDGNDDDVYFEEEDEILEEDDEDE